MQSLSLRSRTSPAFEVVSSVAGRLTFNGLLLFVIGLAMAGSAFKILRVEILGLMVHPYLALVGIIAPLLFVARLVTLPARVVASFFVFAGLYYVSTFSGGVWLGEGLKIAAAVVTVLTAALLVQSRSDFVAGVVGMSLAIGFLAVFGLETDSYHATGVNPLDVANRNAYSLYALPAILLGSLILLDKSPHPLVLKVLLLASIFSACLVICLALNRSGWIGLLVIGLMLLKNRRLNAVFLAVGIGFGIYFLAIQHFGTTHIADRFTNSFKGIESDSLRFQLISDSIEIGMANPLFGASPQGLQAELALRMGYMKGVFLTHNVFAHIFGGSGVFCFAVLLYIGWVLWNWKPPADIALEMRPRFIDARRMLRMLVILWFVRGMFTHEILYSPGFCIALGMCIGLTVVNSKGRSLLRRIDEEAMEGSQANEDSIGFERDNLVRKQQR